MLPIMDSNTYNSIQESLAGHVSTFLEKVKPERPFWRANWGNEGHLGSDNTSYIKLTKRIPRAGAMYIAITGRCTEVLLWHDEALHDVSDRKRKRKTRWDENDTTNES
eukprot:460469-Pelagomonas_calceolata.AAC.2